MYGVYTYKCIYKCIHIYICVYSYTYTYIHTNTYNTYIHIYIRHFAHRRNSGNVARIYSRRDTIICCEWLLNGGIPKRPRSAP